MKDLLYSLLGIVWLFVIFVLPLIVSHVICRKRGRDPNKGVFVTLFTGWIGTAIIWLFLADKRKA